MLIEVEFSDDGRFFRVLSDSATVQGSWMSVSSYAEVPKPEAWEPRGTEVLKVEPEGRKPYYRRVAPLGAVYNILHNILLLPEEDEQVRDWLGCWNLERLADGMVQGE